MKKLYLVIALTCLLNALTTKAQTYHPIPTDSSVWKVVRCYYFFPDSVHTDFHIRIPGSDTILHGQQYKNLYMDVHAQIYTNFDTSYSYLYGAFREGDKKIYIVNYACGDSAEHLVYDFNNYNVGDTIYTQKDAINCDTMMYPHVLLGIDSVLVAGHYNRRLHVQEPSQVHDEYWTEGVGSNYGLIYATHWETDNSYDLICLNTAHNTEYVNAMPNYTFCMDHPTVYCDSVSPLGVNPPEAKERFSVYPNPVTDEQYLNLRTGQVKTQRMHASIVSTMGATVLSEDISIQGNETHIDIGMLPKGLYVLRLRDQNNAELMRSKFVKL